MPERICVPQSGCAGINVGGVRYLADKGGVMTVDNPAHAALMRKGAECFPAAHTPVGADGFVCADCGFTTFFKRCGRCGGTCNRPGASSDGTP